MEQTVRVKVNKLGIQDIDQYFGLSQFIGRNTDINRHAFLTQIAQIKIICTRCSINHGTRPKRQRYIEGCHNTR